ncbi:MAG: hypothetical protein IKT17_10475 [Lachnospiraceae bacterium]|nr:hypothetical protein [Lachnospiraceae bacterium]
MIEGVEMPDQYVRTRMLLGDEAVDILRRSRVAVFGIGGVGGYAHQAGGPDDSNFHILTRVYRSTIRKP